jgi:hypothetical protein
MSLVFGIGVFSSLVLQFAATASAHPLLVEALQFPGRGGMLTVAQRGDPASG